MLDRAFDILLVEDYPEDVGLVQLAFSATGLPDRLHVVGDGEAALSYLAGRGIFADRQQFRLPDFMLLDLGLPRISGFELLAALQADPDRHVFQVHALTGTTDQKVIQRAYELGVTSCLLKPATLMDWVILAKRLHNWQCVISAPPKVKATALEVA